MGILKNFRRGFATNSSSSHSFVYMKNPDSTVGEAPVDMDFGWDDFRLSTLKEKLFYVLVGRIGGSWGTEEIDPAIKEDFPEFDEEVFAAAANSYVDHQSRGTITMEQARDPFVTVFGGNDNDGESQERAAAFNEIDWDRTEPNYEEEERLIVAPLPAFIEEASDHVTPPL